MRHPPSQRLSDYLDGELSERGARKLEDHLLECDQCSNLLEDLKEIQNRAHAVPDQKPDRDLWPGIAKALDGAGAAGGDVIRLHPSGPHASPPSPRRVLRFTIPQAVAAGLALAIFSASAGTLLGTGTPVNQTPEQLNQGPPAQETFSGLTPEARGLAAEVARLEGLLVDRSTALDPSTSEILLKNLQVMDEAIRESLEALEADPGNEFLETHLTRSYRAKADYLRETAEFVSQMAEAD